MKKIAWLSYRSLASLAVASSLCASAVADSRPGEFQSVPPFLSPAAAERAPGSLLVKFLPGTAALGKQQVRDLVDGTLVKSFDLVPGLEHLSVPGDVQAAIDKLMIVPLIEYAEPDYIVHRFAPPTDTNYALLWGLNNTGQTVNGDPGIADADIDAPEAWSVSTGSPSTVIGDIDTGVNYNHPDLAANAWLNPGEIAGNGVDDDGNGFIDDTRGWDFFSNDNDPIDDNGHGTHTAGTIGAVGNNGVGVTGVNWQCKIMALKFLGASGSGSTSGAIGCLNYAVAKGCKVSNNSWGGGGFSQAMLDSIVAAGNAGHIFVAAAGNGGADQVGDNNDSIANYPSNYNSANVIAVASTTNNDTRSSFSNYGATTVDLGAPGSTILSTYNSGYAYLSGTSMATPHVTGVVALVQTQNPSWTVAQVKAQILNTARPISALAGITVTGGVVNAAAALGGGSPPANTAPTVTISAPSAGAVFNVGASVTFTGSATDTQDGTLTASLAWSSSLQGALGSGGSFSRSDLVLGTHTITASVTDSGGLAGSAQRTITVQNPPPNTAPTVTITAPAAGSTFNAGASITFTGTATDTGDGTLTGSLSWSSSLQGVIGSGGSFSRSDLIVGTHTITASVTDSGGLTGSAQRSITIQTAPAGPPAAPSGLTVTRLAQGSARLNWTDNSGNESGFNIERQRFNGIWWQNTTTLGPVGANVTTFDNAPGNSRYRYRIRSYNGSGSSAWTGYVTIDLR